MQYKNPTTSWFTFFLKVAFTAAVYFVLARISLLLQFENSNASPVWPPSGFAFAMVLLWGYRMGPGIFFGAFAANLMLFIANRTVDYPLGIALSGLIGVGNMGEALFGAFLLRKLVPEFHPLHFFRRVSHIFHFSITAALMACISCLVGSLSVRLSDIILPGQFGTVIVTWWLGNFSGILLITPFILTWLSYLKYGISSAKISRQRTIEIIVLLISLILVTGTVFNNWFIYFSVFDFAFWIIPLFVWAALRFTPKETMTTMVICSVMAIVGTIHHEGTFGRLPQNEALIALQAFISIMVITKMAMNLTVFERKKTEAQLRNTGMQLEERVRKRTSQLEERTQFVETILQSSIDSIVVADADMRCISINRVAKSYLRQPFPENAVGKKITDFPELGISLSAEDDIRLALQGQTIHRDTIASTISDQYFEVDYVPLKNSEGVYAVMIVSRDITQRIHQEHEIREQKAYAELLIENSPYMIYAYDKNLNATAWNRKAEDHTGMKKEDVIGKNMFDLFPQYDTPEWKQKMETVLTEGKPLHLPKIEFTKRPGWGESFVTPLRNTQQQIIGILFITRDITEMVRITNDLRQKNEDLIKTNTELSSFAYVASHDLQEPLRKIQLFSNRILDSEGQALSPHNQDYFLRMKNAAQRMQQLIEDLLMYSRTGNMARNFEIIHLHQLVEETKADLHDELNHRNVIIEADNLCACRVIPFQFRQLLYNLISNSVKFARPGEDPHIKISSQIDTGEGFNQPNLVPHQKYCYIKFEDHGIGFEPEFNDQIFGLFQRLHGKSEYPGTGIGLSICKKIIENHNGVITAEGKPGTGATFHIYIPDKE